MGKVLLILRTLRYVKPIQILNRLWRKFLPKGACGYKGSTEPLGEFEFLNTKGDPRGWNDPGFEKLWLYNLHYFDYLAAKGHEEGAELIEKWIKVNPVGYGNGWEPYPVSLRVVNWIKYFMRRGRSPRPAERESLETQMKWLYPRLEYHLLANHLLANAKALVFAGQFLGNEKWYRKGMAIYRKELPEQTCADGVNFERSPMYHCIILEDVLDCYKLTQEPIFGEYASKMLAGLKMLTGPDGKIAKFNDATEGIAKRPDDLEAYAERLGVAGGTCRRQSPRAATVRTSGFLRLENGRFVMIAKCGEVGPSYQPGHAHADTGSFELWKDGRRIIGDTGCSTYVPGPIRDYERSTAAHNTVVIDGQNSSEVWAAHRMARRARLIPRRRGDAEEEVAYRDFRGFEIRRKLGVTEAGLRGEDEIRGNGEHVVEVRWHLPPDVGKDELEIVCPDELIWEPCQFAVGWNVRKVGQCAIWRKRAKLPVRLEWSVRFHDRTAFC